jgi:hypothetical protein
MRGVPTVMLEVPDRSAIPGNYQDRVVDPKERVVTHRAAAGAELSDVHPEDLTYGRFVDPEGSPLKTHQWAALSAELEGNADNPARHAELGRRLRAAGYNPIEQQGIYKDVPENSYLVFGITPAEALRFGDQFEQDSVITNTHMWYGKASEHRGMAQEFDPDAIRINVPDEMFVSVTNIEGRPVRWATSYDPDSPYIKADINRPASSQRVRGTTKMVAVKLTDKDLEDLPRTVANLEKGGARVSRVFAPGRPPQGWANVREHLYTDGTRQVVVRTADPELASPNGFGAWVPQDRADRLAASNPLGQRARKDLVVPTPREGTSSWDLDGLAITNTPDVLTKRTGAFRVDTSPTGVPALNDLANVRDPQPGLVIRRGGMFHLVSEEGDVTQAVRIGDLLARLGVAPEKIHIAIGEEAAKLSHRPERGAPGNFVTSWSATMPGVRRTSNPVPHWKERWGIELDPMMRDDQTHALVRLDDEHLGAMEAAFSKFFDTPEHSQMTRLIQFSRIGVGKWDGDPKNEILAWATSSPSVEIGLNPKAWNNPDQLRADVVNGVNSGWYVPNVMKDNPAGQLIAHELGHVVHYALRASFQTKGAADVFERDVLKKLKKSIPAKQLHRELSRYGAENFEEFMAEALSEAIFSSSARPLAQRVYNTVMDQFRTNSAKIPETSLWKQVA